MCKHDIYIYIFSLYINVNMILTLVRVRRLTPLLINSSKSDEVEQFCKSLQIVTRRDVDGTATTVIRAMLEKCPNDPISSTELANKTNLNRITVIHHLRRLENVGIVQKNDRKYLLLPYGFEDFVLRMREQTDQMFEQARFLAKKIDEQYIFLEDQRIVGKKRKLSKLKTK